MHRPYWNGALLRPGRTWRRCIVPVGKVHFAPVGSGGAGRAGGLVGLWHLLMFLLALVTVEASGLGRLSGLSQGMGQGASLLKLTPAVTSAAWGGVSGWVAGGVSLAMAHGLPVDRCDARSCTSGCAKMRLEFRYATVGVDDAGDEPGLVDADVKPVTETSLVEGLAAPLRQSAWGWGHWWRTWALAGGETR